MRKFDFCPDRRTILSTAARAWCLAALLPFACGCGEAGSKPDATTQATVSGSVTNDGKALKQDSNVVFYCSEKGATASGKLDALGKFSLTAADPRIGIPAGRYQVMFTPPSPPAVQMGTKDYEKIMTGGQPAGATVPTGKRDVSEIPDKFQTFETSGIALEIKPGNNDLPIDLAKFQ